MRKAKTAFAACVVSAECRNSDGVVLTPAGTRFWICREPDGWVSATGSQLRDGEPPPDDLRTWKNREAAERFARRWKGHPFWVIPNGDVEIYVVRQKLRIEPDGWELVTS